MTKVIGYLRVSTREQADSRLGLQAQKQAIQREADHRGWTVKWIEDAGHTGTNGNRKGLQDALKALRRKECITLVVAKLDRLSRSVQDFAELLKQAQRQRWAIVSLNPDIDMTNANGRFFARMLIEIAQWESEIIGERTRDAMAVARLHGATFGRTRVTSSSTVKTIMRLRKKGLSYRAIASELDLSNTPTPNGATQWQHSTVRRIVMKEKQS